MPRPSSACCPWTYAVAACSGRGRWRIVHRARGWRISIVHPSTTSMGLAERSDEFDEGVTAILPPAEQGVARVASLEHGWGVMPARGVGSPPTTPVSPARNSERAACREAGGTLPEPQCPLARRAPTQSNEALLGGGERRRDTPQVPSRGPAKDARAPRRSWPDGWLGQSSVARRMMQDAWQEEGPPARGGWAM